MTSSFYGYSNGRDKIKAYETSVVLMNTHKEIKAFVESSIVDDGDELDNFCHPVSGEVIMDLYSLKVARAKKILTILKDKHSIEVPDSTRFILITLHQNDSR